MKYTTGRTADSSVRVAHKSYAAAIRWINTRAKVDPQGVRRGDYYIDQEHES